MKVSMQCDFNSFIGKNFPGGNVFTAFAGFDELE